MNDAETLAYHCYTLILFVFLYAIGFKIKDDFIRVLFAFVLTLPFLLVLTYFLGFPSWN